MEKLKREQLRPLLLDWLELLSEALSAQQGAASLQPQAEAIGRLRTGAEILCAMQRLQRALDLLQANVGVGTLLGWLQVALR